MELEIDVIENESIFQKYIADSIERGLREKGYMIPDVHRFSSMEEYDAYRRKMRAEEKERRRFVLVDLYMEGRGENAFVAIKDGRLRRGENKIWAFSRCEDLAMIASMIRSGEVDGYLSKTWGEIEDVVQAIEATIEGEHWESGIMQAALRSQIPYGPDRLSDREREAMRLLNVRKKKPKQVASEMGVEVTTVYEWKKRAESKLGTGDPVEISDILCKMGIDCG